MASAEMIHFGLDPGKLVCFLSGEYPDQYRSPGPNDYFCFSFLKKYMGYLRGKA